VKHTNDDIAMIATPIVTALITMIGGAPGLDLGAFGQAARGAATLQS
jgi:hypothetical protein